MHSIKNVSERNKIDTQSSADAYIRRKRLISKSDHNLTSGCTYKYSWNWKNPKNSLFWANIKKNKKKQQKTQKKQPPKKTQKTHWAGFKKKPRVFFQPWKKERVHRDAVLLIRDISVRIRIRGSVPLTNGSRFGSWSWYVRQWPSRSQIKNCCLFTFWS